MGEIDRRRFRVGTEGFRVRRYLPQDREHLVRLVGLVWGQEMSDRLSRIWDWKYEQNPQNPPGGHNSLVMEFQGEPVGFMGYLSADIQIGDRIVPMAWGSELSVNPKYRGNGWLVLKYVTEHSERICAGSSIPHKIYLIYKRLGGVDVLSSVSLKRVLRVRRFLGSKRRNPVAVLGASVVLTAAFFLQSLLRSRPGTRKGQVEPVTRFDEGFDEFWERARRGYDVLTVRTAAVLNWRFCDCPIRDYDVFALRRDGRVDGYVVTRWEDDDGLRRGYLVDLLVERADAVGFNHLVHVALKHLRGQGVDVVSFVCAGGSADLIKRLRLNGFLFTSPGTKFIAHPGGTRQFDRDVAHLDHARDFYLTRIDTDMDYMAGPVADGGHEEAGRE